MATGERGGPNLYIIVAIDGVRLLYDNCAWMLYAEDDSLLRMLCAHVDDPYCSADPGR